MAASLVDELVDAGLAEREARWLVEHFEVDGPNLREAAHRRLGGEPLQYVIGRWPFRDLELDVDARALIPRPETEGLVDVALDEVGAHQAPLIVDLGCGGGAIGLALVVEFARRGVAATLVAGDESDEALDLARQNARQLAVQGVTFVRTNWFDGLDQALRGRVDLVVANPPYVGASELDGLDPVLGYEPRGALISPDARGVAGLGDLEVLVREARTWLAPGAVAVFEHGEQQREALLALAHDVGYRDVRDVDDLAGRPRVLVVRS